MGQRLWSLLLQTQDSQGQHLVLKALCEPVCNPKGAWRLEPPASGSMKSSQRSILDLSLSTGSLLLMWLGCFLSHSHLSKLQHAPSPGSKAWGTQGLGVDTAVIQFSRAHRYQAPFLIPSLFPCPFGILHPHLSSIPALLFLESMEIRNTHTVRSLDGKPSWNIAVSICTILHENKKSHIACNSILR